MQEPAIDNPHTESPEEPKHWLQKLMDNHWLLLVLGIVIPLLSYTLWGWVELANMPNATLP